MKLFIGLTVSYESDQAIQNCFSHIYSVYPNLSHLFIFNDNHPTINTFISKFPNLIISPASPSVPNFISLQLLIQQFLQTNDTHFIKLDIDTIVLNKPQHPSDIEGQRLTYSLSHQQARWQYMPLIWQEANPTFRETSKLYSVHGGYIFLSRKICEQITPFFWKETNDWPYLHIGTIRETLTSPNMIGEEQMLGWYLFKAKVSLKKLPTVEKKPFRYQTYRSLLSKITKNLYVFHPIKTQQQYLTLIEKYNS